MYKRQVCSGLRFANVVTTEIWGSRKQSSEELAELFRANEMCIIDRYL